MIQRLQQLPTPLKILAYAVAAAAVLALSVGVGVMAALTNAVLGVVLLLGVATLAVAIGTLRSSRRSEGLGESRYELLREERRTPLEELERESQERRQLTEYLEETDPRFMENLKQRQPARIESEREVERLEEEGRRLQQEHQRLEEELEQERRGHQDILRRAEGLEREQTEMSEVQQEAERLSQERQRLAEELAREREEHVSVQKRAERQEQELASLEQELERSQAELERRKRAPTRAASRASHPWWRRPLLVVGLLLGVLIAWFTSLGVALNMLAS